MNPRKLPETINENRRTFLAFGATGVAAFVLGKMFGGEGWGDNTVMGRAEFDEFILTETRSEMRLTDKKGEPIVVIDKDSFRE